MYKRIFLIIIDSLGVGELPDANLYNDVGSNTLLHITESKKDLNIPNLESLGIGCIIPLNNIKNVKNPKGTVLKLKELSKGKDTLTGHWEIMGLKTEKPFKTFTDTGFPKELIEELENRTNRKVIGNISCSGVKIINDLGLLHMTTGNIIVYTSADSVLQIAAHEEIVPIEELYDICEKAREITMKDEWKVGRIIARPFVGDTVNGFTRTSRRHDYALSPFADTVLNNLVNNEFDVISIGKIVDIFNNSGITKFYKSKSSIEGMNQTIDFLDKDFNGLCFTNLVDFDSLYGHMRDPIGYGKALEDFDLQLGTFLNKMKDDDLLIISADHGNDPTFHGTDHTREYVPCISFSKNKIGKVLNDGDSFADIGATIADNFNIKLPNIGKSFLDKI